MAAGRIVVGASVGRGGGRGVGEAGDSIVGTMTGREVGTAVGSIVGVLTRAIVVATNLTDSWLTVGVNAGLDVEAGRAGLAETTAISQTMVTANPVSTRR